MLDENRSLWHAWRYSLLNVLQFQSPLAVADNLRASSTTAVSGYNRPPNRRYQQLLEQGSSTHQQPHQSVRGADSRYTAGISSGDPRRRQNLHPAPNSCRQPTSLLDTVITYSAATLGNYTEDAVLSTSDSDLAEGSLKDMFKTIDPTASPFC